MNEYLMFFSCFLITIIFYFAGGIIEKPHIKKSYCKHIYEKHIEVDECENIPFPWEVKE